MSIDLQKQYEHIEKIIDMIEDDVILDKMDSEAEFVKTIDDFSDDIRITIQEIDRTLMQSDGEYFEKFYGPVELMPVSFQKAGCPYRDEHGHFTDKAHAAKTLYTPEERAAKRESIKRKLKIAMGVVAGAAVVGTGVYLAGKAKMKHQMMDSAKQNVFRSVNNISTAENKIKSTQTAIENLKVKYPNVENSISGSNAIQRMNDDILRYQADIKANRIAMQNAMGKYEKLKNKRLLFDKLY